MSYITNIDTLSALLDRLISENIKLHFFRKEDVVDDIEHQENLIEEIKYRITQLLLDTNQLNGLIPVEMGNLTNLLFLRLKDLFLSVFSNHQLH